jgi:hypothetical protein
VEVCFAIIGKAWTITTSELAGCILKDNVTFTMRKDGARGEHVDYGRARPYAPAQIADEAFPLARHCRDATGNPGDRS